MRLYKITLYRTVYATTSALEAWTFAGLWNADRMTSSPYTGKPLPLIIKY